MKLDELQKMWSEDVVIDETNLDEESLKIPKLHSKYYNIYLNERLVLLKIEGEYKKLKKQKHEFYTQGPSDFNELDQWKDKTGASKGNVSKSEIELYMDADEDILEMINRKSLQEYKVTFVEDIIKSLVPRGFLIKSSMDWQKFTSPT